MKKLLFAAAILFVAFNSNAQTKVVKWNFLSAIVSTANFSYEQVVNDGQSAQLGVFYTGFSMGDTKFSGFGITPEYRFYLTDYAPTGIYLAPFLRYQNFKLEDEFSASSAKYSSFGGGAIVGHHWIWNDRWSFDTFVGPMYNSGGVTESDGDATFEVGRVDGFGVRLGVTLGFAF